MAEHSVKLPEPRSDDSEDVVWGLSTASALWARGERKDAVVWIRRAADAAEAAGNPFRASELGMYLPDLEKALQAPLTMPDEEAAPVSDPAPISSFEIVLDADTPPPPVVLPPLAIPALGPVTPAPAPVAAVPAAQPSPPAPTGSSGATEAAAPTPPTMPPAVAAAPPPPAVVAPALAAPVVAPNAPPVSGRQTPIPAVPAAAAAPPPAAVPAAVAPAPAASVVAPNAPPVSGRQTPIPAVPAATTNQTRISPPPAQANVRPQTTAPQRKASQIGMKAVVFPVQPPPEVAPPAPPPVEDPPSVDEGRSALPPPAPLPSVNTPAPAAPAPQPAQPAVASKDAPKRRQVLRTPILDPWSEASTHEVLKARERNRRQDSVEGGQGATRPRTRMLLDEDDDDVITSAPPLAETIGKKHTGGHVAGGTGLAQTPPAPAARAGAPAAPPPLPPRAPGVAGAAPPGGRPPPLPPAVAAPTPMPPTAAVAPVSAKPPSQPPPAATPAPPTAAPMSARSPSPAPPPPAPGGPTSAKTPTQPPPPVAPVSAKVPTPPPPDDDEDAWGPPRKIAPKAPTPAPEPPAAPVASHRAKPSTDAPDQESPPDIVPTAPRPIPRKSPTIPPAPKLPTGALGKPAPLVPRPPALPDDATPAEDDDPRRKLSDTLPSGITVAAIVQAEAEAAANRSKTAIPPPPVGTKPLFEITKKPGPGQVLPPAAPRVPAPAPRAAMAAPKVPSIPPPPPSGGFAKAPPPPSVGSPPPPPKTRSSLPPPAPVRESMAPPADPIRISNVELRAVEPFAQLPEEMQRALVRTAIIEDLVPGEARTVFGAVLVVAGEISVCAVNLDVPVKLAGPRSFIASRGSLAESVPMRVLGGSSGATISRWSGETFEQALGAHSQAMRDCRTLSDALQARIGLTLGALAEVDLATREAMLSRLEVRVLEPDEVITEEDGPMPGLVFVVGGSVEILEGTPAVVVADVRPGDLLFPEALWAGAAAPLRSRAASSGALLLVGDRKLALDFAERVPVVGELLSR